MSLSSLKSSSSLDLSEDVSLIASDEVAEAVVTSNDFIAKSVRRKLENCTNSSDKLASRSVGYSSWRIFALSTTSSTERSLSFRRKPNLAAIPVYAPSRFRNSASILSIMTRNVSVWNLLAGVCDSSGADAGSS